MSGLRNIKPLIFIKMPDSFLREGVNLPDINQALEERWGEHYYVLVVPTYKKEVEIKVFNMNEDFSEKALQDLKADITKEIKKLKEDAATNS